jgi:hypothetical protein
VVFMDDGGWVHFSHIEGIAVGIFATNGEVYGLDGVECETGAFVVEVDFLDGGLCSEVIEDDGAIDGCGADDIGFGRVVFDSKDGIDVPLELVDGFGSFVGPDLHEGAGGGELVFIGWVVDISDD